MTSAQRITGFQDCESYDAVGSICGRYMVHLFASKRYPYPAPRSQWQATLPAFISSVFRLSGFDTTVAIVAITFLVRYKETAPNHVAYNDDAFRLFFSSYIVASKVVYDYSLESLRFWKRMGSDLFSCKEIKMMETEFCRVLDWDFRIDMRLFGWIKIVVDHLSLSVDVSPKPMACDGVDASPPPSYEDATRDKDAFISTLSLSSLVPPNISPSASEEADQITLARMLFQSPDLKQDEGVTTFCSRSNSGTTLLSSLKRKLFGMLRRTYIPTN